MSSRAIATAFTGLAIGVLPAVAHAAPAVGGTQVLQVVVGLGVVLVLIAATAWGARRVQGLRAPGAGRIRVLEGLAVGAREKLLLVEVDGHRVLLGLCPGRIATLAAFDAQPETPAPFAHTLEEARQTLARSAS